MRNPARHTLLITLFILTGFQLPTFAFTSFKTSGVDLEVLSYGGSLGGFYNIHPREAWSLGVESGWAVVENDDSFTYYNYYNQPIAINHRNLSFVKLLAGATWFPFMESMHPSFQLGFFGAAGPLLSLNTADDETFITRWKKVEPDVTLMGRAGLHVRILTGKGGSYIFRLGYDYAAFDHVIDTRRVYQGLFILVGMEFLNR